MEVVVVEQVVLALTETRVVVLVAQASYLAVLTTLLVVVVEPRILLELQPHRVEAMLVGTAV